MSLSAYPLNPHAQKLSRRASLGERVRRGSGAGHGEKEGGECGVRELVFFLLWFLFSCFRLLFTVVICSLVVVLSLV